MTAEPRSFRPPPKQGIEEEPLGRKKKKPLPPKRKRLDRRRRLQAAPRLLSRYRGKNVIRGYAKHFGVDLLCALKELEILGVKLDPRRVEEVRNSLKARRRSQTDQTDPYDGYGVDWDENLAFIVGFTSGGFPYGLTWEEWNRIQEGHPARGRKS